MVVCIFMNLMSLSVFWCDEGPLQVENCLVEQMIISNIWDFIICLNVELETFGIVKIVEDCFR